MAATSLTTFFFLIAVTSVHSYKILGVFPTHDRNNYLVYAPLFRELAHRDHDVTLITHFSMLDPPYTYKEIILNHNPLDTRSLESVISSDLVRVPFETLLSAKAGNEGCQSLMENRVVQSIIGNTAKFDVIIVEQDNSDCATALGYNLSAPVIAFSTQTLKPWQLARLGIPFDASSTPHPNLSCGKTAGLLGRIKATFLTNIGNWIYYLASQIADHVYLYKFLSDDLPSLEYAAGNVSLTLVNSHNSLHGGSLRPDNVIDVGGIHIGILKPIPTEIERFINEAEHGVIYASFGSMTKESTMPKEKVRELMDAFGSLPFRVLWKWNTSSLHGEVIPRNILVKQWMPQYEILKHNNVKVFITHAGLLSVTEAADAGVPVIAIPLFGDEYGNAAAVRDAGFGTIVHYQDLTKDNVLNAVNTVLSKSFADKARKVSKIWHDRPLSPLESAIYWTEFVARYGGAESLKATSTVLPWYQHGNWDVSIFFMLVTLLLAYSVYKVFAFCCSCWYKEEETIFTEKTRSKRKRE